MAPGRITSVHCTRAIHRDHILYTIHFKYSLPTPCVYLFFYAQTHLCFVFGAAQRFILLYAHLVVDLCISSFFTGLTGSDVSCITCSRSLAREQSMITSALVLLLSISMLKTLGHSSAAFFPPLFYHAIHSCIQVEMHTHEYTFTPVLIYKQMQYMQANTNSLELTHTHRHKYTKNIQFVSRA